MIGLTAAAALSKVVVNNRSIAQIELVSYEFAPLLQSRASLTKLERSLVRKGLLLRGRSGLPFWDSLLAICSQETCAPTGLLQAALFHQPRRGSRAILSRAEVSKGRIQELLTSRTRAKGGLAVSSAVRLNGDRRAHFPLLDLHYPRSSGPENAIAIGRLLLASGFLVLETGKSFHIWGMKPVTKEKLDAFLARALLLSPIVDRAFVAHQLLEGACALRISAGSVDHSVPRVVAAG